MTAEVVIYLAFWAACAIVNALKGKWWMAIIFSAGIIGIITAIRVAKPGSYWDRHWSSVADHDKAIGRFTKHKNAPLPTAPVE